MPATGWCYGDAASINLVDNGTHNKILNSSGVVSNSFHQVVARLLEA